ncbi:hypothetical protein CCMA1212_004899 [Trichoderma ghanense]|uniref:Uncharacterized protein n=1 Tax=Trichoderma ghanense TaxID=65468 RepID=A0ABY2H847_9HYPO
MICPRWTPRATATLANLGGSSRRASCRHAPISSRGEELGSRRWFSTAGGADEDGSSGSPSPEGSQSSGRVHRASSRSTAAPVKEQTPHHLPHRRTRTAASRTAKAADPRRHWTDRKNAGGDHDAAGESTDTAHQMWPQLKRRERPRKHGDEHVENAAFAIPKPVFSPRRSVQNPSGTSDSSGFMLAIDGLSPNLSATDFYRIAPNDFSNWRNAICKVQQQRKQDTLEPLGRYWVTFSTGEAAVSYRDRLIRLHKLNGFKLRSASGLWESSVPSSLKISLASPSTAPAAAAGAVDDTSDIAQPDTPGTESLVELANSFTIAPGSQVAIPIHRQRVALRRPWAKRLAGLVDNLGFGERPPVLMVDVYPPTLTAERLHQFISRDGYNRALRWKVSMPQHLQKSHSQQGSPKMNAKGAHKNGEMDENDEVASSRPKGASLKIKDREAWETMRGRFLLACADEEEARRFQQSWNQRALTTLRPEPVRYMVRASIINW